MARFYTLLLLLLLPLILSATPEQEFPVLFKGRFRPADAYSRLWLYEDYHAQSLKQSPNSSALDFLLNLHVFGHSQWDSMPFFWIYLADTKALANLNPRENRFSYLELNQAIYNQPHIIHFLLLHEFLQAYLNPLNYTKTERFELTSLQPGLWAEWKQSDVVLRAVPPDSPWKFLTPGTIVGSHIREQASKWLKSSKSSSDDLFGLIRALKQFESLSGAQNPNELAYLNRYQKLKEEQLPPKQIASTLEREFPLVKRLQSAGSLFKALPTRFQGEWVSIHALKMAVYSPKQQEILPIGNFTPYSDTHFEAIRSAYNDWERAMLNHDQTHQLEKLGQTLLSAYREIEGKPYQEAAGKTLYYPTLNQLKVETLYYQYAWIKYLIVLYAISAILLVFRLNKLSLGLLGIAFIFHTLILLSRSYILNRPPVSNMFETVIYVPWFAVLGGLFLNLFKRHTLVLIASCVTSIILLIILELTDLNNSLDNVQAVLDSQFWLIIHVLMVVGSYGIYILGAVLGHIYLGESLYRPTETANMKYLAKLILQTMYLGTALLIPGTILGGIWAAESWGRFWDWDPKESWAFISSCLYLIWIHAYRFNKIGSFGLAFGSVCGLLVISFTWYGVNYILGTGLHSYGFGSGGEVYYYAFLGCELLFLGYAINKKNQDGKDRKDSHHSGSENTERTEGY